MNRYIDADKHLQKLGERRDTAIIWELNCNDEATKDRAQEAILIFNECILELINAPTADVRENVKGRWVEVVDRTEMYDKEGVKTWGMLFQCNQCGFVLNAVEGHTGQYNYCPNCGAKMRGDKA